MLNSHDDRTQDEWWSERFAPLTIIATFGSTYYFSPRSPCLIFPLPRNSHRLRQSLWKYKLSPDAYVREKDASFVLARTVGYGGVFTSLSGRRGDRRNLTGRREESLQGRIRDKASGVALCSHPHVFFGDWRWWVQQLLRCQDKSSQSSHIHGALFNVFMRRRLTLKALERG